MEFEKNDHNMFTVEIPCRIQLAWKCIKDDELFLKSLDAEFNYLVKDLKQAFIQRFNEIRLDNPTGT